MKEHKRVWLTPRDPYTQSFVTYYVDDEDSTVSAEVKIADCDRQVRLGFSFGGYEGKSAAMLSKVDRLIDTLVDFRGHLRKAARGRK